MMIQIKTPRNLQFVAGLLLAIVSGCVTGEQPEDAAAYQSSGQYAIRVLLDDEIRSTSIRIDSPYKLISVDTTEVFPAQKTDDTLNIELQADGIKAGFQLLKTKRLIIEPQSPLPLKINNQAYRGSLEFIVNDDGNSMMVINNVSLETYLMGVIAAEMPGYWDAEALKAQAVASRTYCLYIKSRFGKNRNWDVRTTQANQVYKGVAAETMRTNNAVNATAGMVLCCEDESGGCEPFGTYYSSVCGGHTENAQNVFGSTELAGAGESCAALGGVECPYCRQITRPGVFYWPMAKIDKKYVTQQLIERYPSLKELGIIEKIETVKQSVHDGNFTRITSVKLTGSPQVSSAITRKYIEPNSPQAAGKTAYLRAEDMRLAIDPTGTKIQSASCIIVSLENEFLFIAGKGFGHGVGLCQYGAREMARQGKTAQEILNFYYPSSRIKILY